jgi:hypothetical protein
MYTQKQILQQKNVKFITILLNSLPSHYLTSPKVGKSFETTFTEESKINTRGVVDLAFKT